MCRNSTRKKRASKPRVARKTGDEVKLQLFPGCRKWTPGIVVRPHIASRSYVEAYGNKGYRWKSQHLHTSTPVANRLDQTAEPTA